MIDIIRVRMLGGFSVWVDGTPIIEGTAKINKPWQVFCYLVLHRGEASVPSRMISALWPDEMLSDPGNVLKNTVYALRREFKYFSQKVQSPILFEGGGYICNPKIKFEVDAEQFEESFMKAQTETRQEKKLAHLFKAVEAYKGEFLPQLETDTWVMMPTLHYKKNFAQAQSMLCFALHANKNYEDLLSVSTRASKIEPLEEEHYLYMFRAMLELKMHGMIISTYPKAQRLFSEELGVSLSEEISNIYLQAGNSVDKVEKDVMIIKEDLQEVTDGNMPIEGAFYCAYDVFRYLYQIVARTSERNKSKVIILLLTMQSLNEDVLTTKQLTLVMKQIKSWILSGLFRKSDTFARYSKSQYILMLTIEKDKTIDAVVKRLHAKCDNFLQNNKMKLTVAHTQLNPIFKSKE